MLSEKAKAEIKRKTEIQTGWPQWKDFASRHTPQDFIESIIQARTACEIMGQL